MVQSGRIHENRPVASIIAFDVNETLLDLSVLDAPFEQLLGDASWRQRWFAQMLQLSFVGGLTGRYVDFSTAQHAALLMVADQAGVQVTGAQAEAMVQRMTRLPPHPEVAEALALLDGSPLRVAALTNSPLGVAEQQLVNAGIRDNFHRVFSADSVRALKPAPAPYRMVAEALDEPIEEVRLVAAHAWDVAGAMAAGAQAAFVARPGAVLSPLGSRPTIIGSDIRAVIELVLGTDGHDGRSDA